MPNLRSLALLASSVPVLLAQTNNPDSSAGKVLYVTSPACGSYKCTVDWYQGSTVLVNWLASPAGAVSVQLASNDGGPIYSVIASTPGVTTTCDAGAGAGNPVAGTTCGDVSFEVPGGWEIRTNYTVVVSSLTDPTAVGYTDIVAILAANSTTVAVPSGTVVSIISGSTSAAVTSATSAATTATSSTAAPRLTTSVVPSSSTTSAAASASTTAAKSGAGRMEKSGIVGFLLFVLGGFMI